LVSKELTFSTQVHINLGKVYRFGSDGDSDSDGNAKENNEENTTGARWWWYGQERGCGARLQSMGAFMEPVEQVP
jgi:hypothetical protein